MTNEELASEGAKIFVLTGIEGGFGSVSCSSAGDYPSMGVSQWEGINGRGDNLLSQIPGGDKFVGRSYSDIQNAGELDELSSLLNSDEGQAVQLEQLAQDILELYVPEMDKVANLDDSRCYLYALSWCTTSENVVRRFLINRQDSYNIRDLSVVRDMFRDQYAHAADCDEDAEGYANRAENAFQYIASLDLSAYGVPAYGEG